MHSESTADMPAVPSTASRAGGVLPERRGEILQDLAKVACAAVGMQLDDLITRLSAALLKAADTYDKQIDARRCMNASMLLKKNRYPFYYVVSERLNAVMQNGVLRLEKPDDAPNDTGGALATLSPELEVDKKLCLAKVARVLEQRHAEALNTLHARLATLLGRDAVALADSPFRPQLFLSVLHDAWCEFHPDTDAHHLVYPLLSPELCLDMTPVLHGLNTVLTRLGVEPQACKAAVELEDDAVLVPSLQRLFPDKDRKPAAGESPLSGEAETFVAWLDRHPAAAQLPLHTPVLAAMKSEAPAGCLTRSDEHTIMLMSKVFDTVYADPRIPHDVKGLIGALQIPLLKEALRDKDFFFKYAHPARYVVDSLGRIGAGRDVRKGEADPAWQTIVRNVERIRAEAGKRFAVYADVARDLEAYLEHEAAASEANLGKAIGEAMQREKLIEAKRCAKHEVELRVGTGEVVAFVEAFLEDKWVAVLTLAYTVQDTRPDAVADAIDTMDRLVWSVKPKITLEERRELVDKLPDMLASLNKWLDAIKWNDAERLRFFNELARCHASIVRAPLELSPERQMQIALAVAKHAAERRAQRLARQQPEPPPDKFDILVKNCASGTWVQFARTDGSVFKVKLAWVSPMRNFYIFSTRERREAFSLTAEQFAHILRQRKAWLLTAAGLVHRALADALGVVANDADSNMAA